MLPVHLMPHYEPETGLVLGRTPAMVMYLLMKAKYDYALKQRAGLAEELRVAKAELRKEKEEKEKALDLVLGRMFGWVLLFLRAPLSSRLLIRLSCRPEAEVMVRPVPPPPGMGVSSTGSLVMNGPVSGVVHPVTVNGNGR